jgi:transcriptional regulator with XRE-family HTH domain
MTKSLGLIISELRWAQMKNRSQLAKEIGAHHSELWRVESGDRLPSLLLLMKLAKAFGKRPSEMLALAEEREISVIIAAGGTRTQSSPRVDLEPQKIDIS